MKKRWSILLLFLCLVAVSATASAQTAYEAAKEYLTLKLGTSHSLETQDLGAFFFTYNLQNGDVAIQGKTTDGTTQITTWIQNGFDGFFPSLSILAAYEEIQSLLDDGEQFVFLLLSNNTEVEQVAMSADEAQNLLDMLSDEQDTYFQHLNGLWTCLNCSTMNTGEYCTQCGKNKYYSVEIEWKCLNCGRVFSDEEPEFCMDCGTSMGAQQGSTSTVPESDSGKAQEGAPQRGILNSRLATRTGPGTQFEEPGTFFAAGDEIIVYSIAYDVNNVAWIQTEVNTNKGKMRVYSGLKRVDGLDISQLHVEQNLNMPCTLEWDYAPKYGPGPDYATYDFTFKSGRTFTIKDTEGDWAMIEFYAQGDEQWYHLWLPMLYLSF